MELVIGSPAAYAGTFSFKKVALELRLELRDLQVGERAWKELDKQRTWEETTWVEGPPSNPPLCPSAPPCQARVLVLDDVIAFLKYHVLCVPAEYASFYALSLDSAGD